MPHTEISKNTRRKIKYQGRPVAYYSNSVSTQRLILSGDVAVNPGPSQEIKSKPNKPGKPPKCPECTKNVQSNHKRFLCTVCFDLFHAKCTHLSANSLKRVRADVHQEWICAKCHLSVLPFHQCIQEDFLTSTELDNCLEDPTAILDEHLEALRSRPKQLK